MNLLHLIRHRAFSIFLLALSVLAVGQGTVIFSASAQDDPVDTIRAIIQATQPNMVIESITPAPFDGMYQITLMNGQIINATADARYFIPGDLYESLPQGLVNRSEEKRNELRAEKIAAIPESEMIIFEPENGRKATITVFTDVDCPYCRQLHGEMDRMNEFGIAVRYLGYPRTGLETETHHKMVSAWCADDRHAMFTSATRGGEIPEVTCENPIADHYQLGREVGVTGTPALVLQDGTILPGYVPAETLAGYLLGTGE